MRPHTPTPWHIDGKATDPEARKQVLAADGSQVVDCDVRWLYSGNRTAEGPTLDACEEESAANAALIVRAVNHHEDLVAFLETVIRRPAEHFSTAAIDLLARVRS